MFDGVMNNTEITRKLNEIAVTIPDNLIARWAVCEYSADDNTPTLHIDLWRGHDLSELPRAVSELDVASDGFWDGGRCYSMQLPA